MLKLLISSGEIEVKGGLKVNAFIYNPLAEEIQQHNKEAKEALDIALDDSLGTLMHAISKMGSVLNVAHSVALSVSVPTPPLQ